MGCVLEMTLVSFESIACDIVCQNNVVLKCILLVSQDGLFLVTNCLDLVRDYHLAVLTPNINEYKRLVQKVLNCEVNDQEGTQQLLSLAKG